MDYRIQLRENKHLGKNFVKTHHHSVHQILYLLENKIELKFDNEKYSFSKDSLALIPPYSDHSTATDSKATVLVLEFDINKLNCDIATIFMQQFHDPRVMNLNRFEAKIVRKLLRRMLYEQSQGGTINILAVKNYLERLLLVLLQMKDRLTIMDANALRAERLKEYIDTHYFEINDAKDISQKLGISTRHMNSIFKNQYDITPMQYLNEVRMEIAKKLLKETDNDIASICFEVGFEAISTFYRRFKEYTNLSPNKYRIKYQYTNTTSQKLRH